MRSCFETKQLFKRLKQLIKIIINSQKCKKKVILNCKHSRINSRRIVFCVGRTKFVLLAWHLYVEFKWVRCTRGISSLFMVTRWLFVSTFPSTNLSFTNQLTVGGGFPAQNNRIKVSIKCSRTLPTIIEMLHFASPFNQPFVIFS